MSSLSSKLRLIRDDIFLISTLLPLVLAIVLIATHVKSPKELFKFEDKKVKIKNKKLAKVKEEIKESPAKTDLSQSNLMQSLSTPSMSNSNLNSLSAGVVSSSGGQGGGLSVSQGEVASGQMINEAGSDNKAARAVSVVNPKYPASAQARGISGFVIIEVSLNERGQVLDAKVLSSNPTGVFENSALEAIFKWKFEPAISEGKAVATKIKQKVNFELD